MSTFIDLSLSSNLIRALDAEGYKQPTPIQQAAIPPALEGRDILGTAQTGTGKTAAFALPILQHLTQSSRGAKRHPRALILVPTRELAQQVEKSFRAYGRFSSITVTSVIGGARMGPQIHDIRRGVDVLVATPGRLRDLISRQCVDLGFVKFLVLDEADRMLDMGFIDDVKKIVSLTPTQRQTVLFSATMSKEVRLLSNQILNDPLSIEITPNASVSENIHQQILFVEQSDKRKLLLEVFKDSAVNKVLVFTRTKRGANTLALQLTRGGIQAGVIHSDKTQSARQRALKAFSVGRSRVLVATDVVARGIDVDNISHVINFDLPVEAECYVHRIGRTARAGTFGVAMSFCSSEEVTLLKPIEKLIKGELLVVDEHPFHSSFIAAKRNKQFVEASGRGVRRGRSSRSWGNRQGNSRSGYRTERPRGQRRVQENRSATQ